MKSISLMLSLAMSLSTVAASATTLQMITRDRMAGKIEAVMMNAIPNMQQDIRSKLELMESVLTEAAQQGRSEETRNVMGRLINQASDSAKNALHSNDYDTVSEAQRSVVKIHAQFIEVAKSAQ